MINLTTSIQNFFKRASVYAGVRIAQRNDVPNEPAVMSNLQWHGGIMMLEFLQKVGIYARVNTMLNRERYASSFSCATTFTLLCLVFAHG